jgi:hypothetical protein
MELKDTLLKLIKELYPLYPPAYGKILKVNEAEGICSVSFADGRPVNDRVFLQSILTPDFIIIPADGSEVITAFADNTLQRAFIVKVAKVKKIIWKTSPAGTTSIEISDTGINIENDKGRFVLANTGTILGQGTEPMVKGQSLSAWAGTVDIAIQALITWAATGVAPGPAGGIAPLTGVQPTAFDPNILSQENKLS